VGTIEEAVEKAERLGLKETGVTASS